MSKKGTKKREVKEDLEIRKVAYSKNEYFGISPL